MNEANATKEKALRIFEIQKAGKYNLMVHLVKHDLGEKQIMDEFVEIYGEKIYMEEEFK